MGPALRPKGRGDKGGGGREDSCTSLPMACSWLDGLEEQKQRTDVHYRALQGDGSFHWRFVFPFQYLAAEQRCVLPRKVPCPVGRGGETRFWEPGVTPFSSPRTVQEHFWSLDETVLKVPPKLILQVWDNDKFSADDFLGEGLSAHPRRGTEGHPALTLLPAGVLELELTRLPRPAQRPQDCTLKPRLSPWPWGKARGPPRFSLFRQKLARGWWPCVVHEGGAQRMAVRRGRGGQWDLGRGGGERAGKLIPPHIHPLLLL